MKTLVERTVVAAAFVTLGTALAPTAVAQDSPADGIERPTEPFFPEQQRGELRAEELVGLSVRDPNGDVVGEVNDLVISEGLGIKAVVIGMGGFLGFGEKEVAVNFDKLEQERSEYGELELVLRTAIEQVAEAPEFVTLEARRQAELEAARRAEAEAQRQEQRERSPSLGTGTGSAAGSRTGQ